MPAGRPEVEYVTSAMRVLHYFGFAAAARAGVALGIGLELIAVLGRAEVVDRAVGHRRLRVVGAYCHPAYGVDLGLRLRPAAGAGRRHAAAMSLMLLAVPVPHHMGAAAEAHH